MIFFFRSSLALVCDSLDNRLVVSHVVETDAQHVAEDGFAGKQSVAGLLDIVGMGIIVHLVGYLVHTGQRVENLHIGLGQPEHLVVEHVHVLHALILHEVGETLLLHAGHVEDIGIGDDLLIERRVLLILDAVLFAIDLVLLGHRQFLRGHEMERGVEMTHRHEQRVNRPSVLQVAHHIYIKVL